jgi:hypothetical protein
MITPRYFEEQMQEIDSSYNDENIKQFEMLKLMADTLDTLGYSAGTKIYREGRKNPGAKENITEYLHDGV